MSASPNSLSSVLQNALSNPMPAKPLKILVVTTQVPFIRGGAEAHAEGLVDAIARMGHSVELIKLPFKFYPSDYILGLMASVRSMDFRNFNGHEVDRIISLLFPAYGIDHPDHVSWIIHQHRSVYDLFDETQADEDLRNLKQSITEFDKEVLANKRAVYANSENVAKRLHQYCGISAQALYHPPPGAAHFYCSNRALPYVYFPSRIETLKRQNLLVEAASLMKSDLKILISGTGSKVPDLKLALARHKLEGKVEFLGAVSEAEKYALYANCRAVYFGPQDEDLGYVTLEAMLSAKPVLTCTDSGGPLEFIKHGHSGWIVEPEPKKIAEVLDQIAADPEQSRCMGLAGREYYQSLGISWEKVANTLLAGLPGVPAL